ncbi:MAG: hypothetical protein WHV26_02085 [Spirochaetota bacterium]
MSEGVIVKKISGDVMLQKEGKITYVKDIKKLPNNSQYQIIVDDKSYALVYNKAVANQNQETQFLMYPKSMMMVKTDNGFINGSLILLGMVFATMPKGYKIETHTAEFEGSGFIDVKDDGTTIIANTRDTIYNKLTRESITMEPKQQVTITMKSISKPEPIDEKYEQAQKIFENIGQFEAASIYSIASSKSDEFKTAYAEAMKELSNQTGISIPNLDEDLKVFDDYKKNMEQKSSESKEIANTITNTTFSESITIPASLSFQYQGFDCNVTSIKIQKKQDSSTKILIFMKITNVASKQAFIFWNEECRLIANNDTVYELEDYSLKTDFDNVKENDGYLVFIVKDVPDKLILQFGKKSSPKIDLELPAIKSK